MKNQYVLTVLSAFVLVVFVVIISLGTLTSNIWSTIKHKKDKTIDHSNSRESENAKV